MINIKKLICLFLIILIFCFNFNTNFTEVKAVPILPALPGIEAGWGLFGGASGIINQDYDKDKINAELGVGFTDKIIIENSNGEKISGKHSEDFWYLLRNGRWFGAAVVACDSIAGNPVVAEIKDTTFEILKGSKEFWFGNPEQEQAFRMARLSQNKAEASYYLSLVDWSGTEFSKYIDYERDYEAKQKFNQYFTDFLEAEGSMLRSCLYNNVNQETLNLFGCSNRDEFIALMDNQISNGMVTLSNEQIQAINDLLYINLNGASIDVSKGKLLSYSDLKTMACDFSPTVFYTPISYIDNTGKSPFCFTVDIDKVENKFKLSYYNISNGECVYTYLGLSKGMWPPIRNKYNDTYSYYYEARNFVLDPTNNSYIGKATFYQIDKKTEEVTGYQYLEIGEESKSLFLNDYARNMLFDINNTFLVSTSFPKVYNQVPTASYGDIDVNKISTIRDGLGIGQTVSIPIPKPVSLDNTNVADIPRVIADSTAIPASISTSISVPYVPPALPQLPELPDVNVPNDITSKFPFCIPFDLIRGLKILVVPPEIPSISTNIGTTVRGYYIGGQLNLDFSIFEKLAFLSRWLSTFSFIIFLIFATRKLIKW